MTAKVWEGSNLEALLRALGGEAGIQMLLGAAEDSRLDQPERIVWVPVDRSGKIRECVNRELYIDGVVYWETSFAYDVMIRGINLAWCKGLEARTLNALLTLGASKPSVDIEDGSFQPGSVAAEQGALISWRLRVWEPVYYSRYMQGHVETVAIGVNVDGSDNQVPGSD